MISFWRIFWLEILSLARSRTILLLTLAGAGWMFAFPSLVHGDGTAEGARELYVHYSLGGVFLLLVVALLASATGSLAKERAARRLQLTLVRPVSGFAIALGKVLAHVAVGAGVLALACGILALSVDVARPCAHVLRPVLPSPREEARAMYASYLADPETPAAVRRAKKATVLRLLEQRAVDHYQTIATNDTAAWTFEGLDGAESPDGLAVRIRLTNQMDLRTDVRGEFRLGGLSGAVSNITQAVLTIPLDARGSWTPQAPRDSLSFLNRGTSALMLRPRKDIVLLAPADSFAWNLLRTFAGLMAILTMVVAAGVFLSASLGRPVALFVAFAVLAVGEMSPSVVEQYPDALETDLADRIGLVITRFAATATHPLSAFAPLASLAQDECVEPADVARFAWIDGAALPLLLCLLAGLVMPRKQDGL